MRLVVVYGLRTGDYAYLKEFYPARRIADECEKRSVPLRFLFPADLRSFLESASGKDRADTVFLVRGAVNDAEAALPEKAGFRSVNQAAARALANDKLACARFLENHGWPTPKTRSAQDTEARVQADPALQANRPSRAPRSPPPGAFPLVAKPRYGSRGRGVALVRDAEELQSIGGDMIVQEYVAFSRGRDLRVFFAGDRILAVAIREAGNGELVSNACAGGSFRPAPPLPPCWAAMVRAIAAAAGLWYGSVDFLFTGMGQKGCATAGAGGAFAPGLDDPASMTVCEINASPGFEALERDCGFDIAGPLVEALLADFGQA